MISDPFDHLPLADPEALARLTRWGGNKLLRDMVVLFRTEVPARLLAAREATSRGNCDVAGRAAHSLKSTCAMLGAPRMRALAAQVEMLSTQGSIDAIRALLDRLEQEFVNFKDWLDRHDFQEVER